MIYESDKRLEVLEAFISFLFLVELGLRAYAFELKSLYSCVQLFDSAAVILSFGLAVFSVNNPFLAGRSARVLMLLRGGSRVTRAIAKGSVRKAGRVSIIGDLKPEAASKARVGVKSLFLRATPKVKTVITGVLGQ